MGRQDPIPSSLSRVHMNKNFFRSLLTCQKIANRSGDKHNPIHKVIDKMIDFSLK